MIKYAFSIRLHVCINKL